jgi:hypothetical protein
LLANPFRQQAVGLPQRIRQQAGSWRCCDVAQSRNPRAERQGNLPGSQASYL